MIDRVSAFGWLLTLTVCLGPCQYVNADQAEQSITIDLQQDAVVESARYKLSDIAQIRADDPRIRRRLESLIIGAAPRIGYVDKIRKLDLLSRIERHLPGLQKNITWKGPEYCRVKRLGVTFEKQQVIKAAEKKLHHWLSQRYENFNLVHTGNHDDLYLPKGSVTIKPHLKEGVRLNKRMNVWVDIFVGGRHYQSLPVWFGVSVEAPVLVVTKDAKRGNKIIDNYVARDEVDIAAISGIPARGDDLDNKRLTRNIKAGEVVTNEVLENIPAVTKGSRVSVEASAGSVVIRSVAIALDDGMVGEMIKVAKPNTKIEYTVKVIGKNLVTADKE